MRLGWPEILLIVLVVLIVFGVGKLPQVGGAIGKGIREFRKGARGDFDEEEVVEPKAQGTEKPTQDNTKEENT
jgi:sec-independent protein translocase protein TatA